MTPIDPNRRLPWPSDRCRIVAAVRGAGLTVRYGPVLQLCFALIVLLSFLAIHIVECAAATSHSEADERAVAAQTVELHDGPRTPDDQHQCDHDDGHDHDGAVAEVCVASPRTADQVVAAEPPDSAATDWSAAGILLLLRVRRRPGPPCPAASPRGRDLLLSVCIART